MNKLTVASRELCDSASGETLWQDELCRVVPFDDPGFPSFCRVILNRPVREMTDPDTEARQRLSQAAFAAGQALRNELQVSAQ